MKQWWLPLVEQITLTFPNQLCSYSIFSQIPGILCIMLWTMFVSLSPFGHCTVCPSSVDGFLLSTWHFQTFLNWINTNEQIHSLTNQLSWEQCYRLLMNLKLSRCELESRLLRGVLDTLICDKISQWLAADMWISLVLRFPPPIKLTTTI
jgi:hypothetical protein